MPERIVDGRHTVAVEVDLRRAHRLRCRIDGPPEDVIDVRNVNEQRDRRAPKRPRARVAAVRRGIPIREPFAGLVNWDRTLKILGPTEAFYLDRLDEFDLSAVEAVTAALRRGAGDLITMVRETLWEEVLPGGETTARNDSSVITMIDVDGDQLLLTGDAGIPALEEVLDRLEAEGFSPGDFKVVQLPHHGSRRNVSTEVLDRLLGPAGQMITGRAAVVSCARASDKHPSRRVSNAFLRRNCPVTATNGRTILCHSPGFNRPNWSPVEPLPFYEDVEDID